MAIHISPANIETEQPLPYADEGVKAGFPSPDQNYIEESIDLNRLVVRHPATTFYAHVVGDSMLDAGISDGDLIVVDRSLRPQDSNVVVACIDGEFTLKRIKLDSGHGCLWLMPENPKYKPIKVTEDNHLVIWGVVTHCIKRIH